MGIGKRELLEDYYPAELPLLFEAWGALHGANSGEQAVDPLTFLGTGGETIDG